MTEYHSGRLARLNDDDLKAVVEVARNRPSDDDAYRELMKEINEEVRLRWPTIQVQIQPSPVQKQCDQMNFEIRQAKLQKYEREHLIALHDVTVAKNAVRLYRLGIRVGVSAFILGAAHLILLLGITLLSLSSPFIPVVATVGLVLTSGGSFGLYRWNYRHRIQKEKIRYAITDVGYIDPYENLALEQQLYADAAQRLTDARLELWNTTQEMDSNEH